MMTTKVPAAVVGADGPPTGSPTGPAPVLVIDDEPAGAMTTLQWLADAGYPTAAESDGVLHKPGSARALVREVRRLEGIEALEPGSARVNDGGEP
jgi:hypothetical protein